MGCTCSKQNLEAIQEPPPGMVPADIQLMVPPQVNVPPQYRDAKNNIIEFPENNLTADMIQTAFTDMATYLGQRGIHATVVVAGGAVNTVLLRSRETTGDVDFFTRGKGDPQIREVYEAAKNANGARGGILGVKWFNNTIQFTISRDRQSALFDEARHQNAVVFHMPSGGGSLTVLAAPWLFAVCGKLHRVSKGSGRDYDLDDAIAYMHHYLGSATIGGTELKERAKAYGYHIKDEILHEFAEQYAQWYGRRQIDLTR